MYVLERSVLDLIPPGEERLDRARRLPAAGRRAASARHAARRLLDGHRHAGALPAGELGHPRGARSRRGSADRAGHARRRRRRRSPRTPASARAPSSARLPDRAGGEVRGLGPARAIAWSVPAPRSRGSILAAGVEVAAGADLEGAVVGRDERVARPDDAMLDDVLAHPRPPRATPSGGSSRRGSKPPTRPACSSAGWAARRSAATSPRRRSATASPGRSITVRGYELPSWATPEWTVLCSSYSGDTEETLACFEAADGARRAPHRRQHRRHAGRRRPRGRRAGDRPAGDPAAARRGRLHVRRRRRGRRAGRRRAADPRPRSTPRPPSSSASAERPAGRARPRSPRALDGHAPGRLRRRPDRAGRPPLEDAGQRERQAAGLLLRAARGRPQRDLRLGRRARGAQLAAVFLEDRDQHPRVRRRFELTAEAIAGDAGTDGPGRDRGGDAASRGCSGR